MTLSDLQGSDNPYELYGIVVHKGTVGQGHYISFIKNNSQWYEINDNRVQPVTPEFIKEQHAYMLFYESQELKVPAISIPAAGRKRKSPQ